MIASSRWWSRPRSASGAAIYLSEYADRRLATVLKPILETLAGVPSVVMGFFALTVISPDFVQKLFSERRHVQHDGRGDRRRHPRRSRSWPRSPRMRCTRCPRPREAAYGIGSRRRTVTRKVVFPAAVSGHRGRGHPRASPARSARRWWSRSRPARPADRFAPSTSLGPGQTMTGADRRARDRLGPGRGAWPARRSTRSTPLLRRAAPVRHDAGPQRPERAVRPRVRRRY